MKNEWINVSKTDYLQRATRQIEKVKKKCKKNEENINRSQEEKLWQNGVNRPDTRSRDVKIMKIMIHIKNCFSLEISVLLSISSQNNLKLKINFWIWLQYWSYPDVHIYDKKFPDKKKRKTKTELWKFIALHQMCQIIAWKENKHDLNLIDWEKEKNIAWNATTSSSTFEMSWI